MVVGNPGKQEFFLKKGKLRASAGKPITRLRRATATIAFTPSVMFHLLRRMRNSKNS